jgi:uncharacterized protein YprB with RNaseH-like and TPR domain
MLQNTFVHLPHIGPHTEETLWSHDITNWDDLLKEKNEYAKRFQHLNSPISLSQHKLRLGDVRFFTDRLVSNQHWRIFPEFQDVTAYLDIETTGLGRPEDYITAITLYDGKQIHYYVHGKNMDKFKRDIKKYQMLVTYNGKCFDVPFIEREFGITLPHAHLDLRYILNSIGIKGGLKKCEHQLGLGRGELEGVDGFFAVLLWKDYLAGNKAALDTLLAYNIEDTVNLEKLMIIAFTKKVSSITLESNAIIKKPKKSKPIRSPFKPDLKTIKKIRGKYY